MPGAQQELKTPGFLSSFSHYLSIQVSETLCKQKKKKPKLLNHKFTSVLCCATAASEEPLIQALGMFLGQVSSMVSAKADVGGSSPALVECPAL